MARAKVASSKFYSKTAAEQLAEWTTRKTPKKTNVKRNAWNRECVQFEMEQFIAKRDWTGATPKHFVELYSKMHMHVYGVEALELKVSATRLASASLCKRCLVNNFNSDVNALADFIRWVWIKQQQEEKKRKVNETQSDFRVSWRYQWADSLVTQYNRFILTLKKERSE